MKRTAIFLLLSIMTANAGAQTMYDALRYSTNDYKGSARSLGMGNAVTALGGDLGSITINPAGSAVSSYSQVTISPGFSFYGSKATYYPVAGNNDNTANSNGTYTRMTCPNFGFILKYDTGNVGLKSVTFSMVGNQTNNYVKSVSAHGINDQTTFLGSMAAGATGIASSALNNSDSYYNSNIPWNTILAYQSGMIATYGGNSDQYIGATEKLFTDGGNNTIATAGALKQRYGQQSRGNKYDVAFNVGFNINDIVFLGANIGITSLDYIYDEYFKEEAVDPADFELEFDGGATTNFNNARYRYAYDANGTGVYGKIGIIVTPYAGFRFGAAIQTPTAIDITEHWSSAGETNFSDSKYSASAQTPRGEYSYRLRTPYRINAGAAYTFGKVAVISADYEMCDYSTMKFKVKDSNDNSTFDDVNDDIQNYAGIQHMLRAGIEVKPMPDFALRAGYDLTTSPEYYYNSDNAKKNLNSKTRSFSFGAGYSSEGSFFTDIACKYTKYAKEYIAPYSDYILDSGNNVLTYSPEILNKPNLWDIVWTVGWRF